MTNFLRNLLAWGAMGALLLVTSSAQAILIEADDPVFGLNALTVDTETGLQWLDLTHSLNFSYAAVEAGEGGFLSVGLRHATEPEVAGLFVAAGIPNLSDVFVTENFVPASQLMSLLGCTGGCTSDVPFTSGRATLVPDDAIFAGTGFIQLNLQDMTARALAQTGPGIVTKGFASPGIGNWLVRTSGSSDLLDMVCELKVDKEGVEKSLHFETFNTDPDLQAKWDALFGVTPGTSVDAMLTLQAERTVTWEAGVLEMGGTMKLKIKADKHNPALKKVKIKKAGKKDGTTLYISGTGALNANLADGGWPEVKVKHIDNVTVTFGGDTMTGFVKQLEVKLAADSTTGAPILKHFKLEIEGMTSAVDVNKGTVSSVVVEVPATVITALAGVEYEEKIKDKPLVLGGHTEAESKLDKGVSVLADISTLVDGNNDQLKERKGACDIGAFEFRAEIVSVPTLITPINNVAITQNDPNIGCPPHPTRGFGSRIFFDWTDSSSPNGIAGYHIFAKHQNAQFPIVDTFVTASEFTTTRCNSFVIDANLEGWGWDVQARDNFGNLSPKSETGTFKFEPCRLDDGTPCFAPG